MYHEMLSTNYAESVNILKDKKGKAVPATGRGGP
jgi:hypothetical protein